MLHWAWVTMSMHLNVDKRCFVNLSCQEYTGNQWIVVILGSVLCACPLASPRVLPICVFQLETHAMSHGCKPWLDQGGTPGYEATSPPVSAFLFGCMSHASLPAFHLSFHPSFLLLFLLPVPSSLPSFLAACLCIWCAADRVSKREHLLNPQVCFSCVCACVFAQ